MRGRFLEAAAVTMLLLAGCGGHEEPVDAAAVIDIPPPTVPTIQAADGQEEHQFRDDSPLSRDDIIRIAQGLFLEYEQDPRYAEKFDRKWSDLRRTYLGSYKQDEPWGDTQWTSLRVSAVPWTHVPGGWTFVMQGDVQREPIHVGRWSIVGFYTLPRHDEPIVELITLDREQIVSDRSPETTIDIRENLRESN